MVPGSPTGPFRRHLSVLMTLEAAPGKEEDLEALLGEAVTLAAAEPATTAWFALKSGKGDYEIFDEFPDEAGRQAHLQGAVATAIRDHADLLNGEPQLESVEILADKRTIGPISKGLLLRLPIKEQHRDDAAAFLKSGRDVVEQEPATTDWFALQFPNGDYGVFDVFPDSKGRRAHLTGRIPQQLALHGLPWLGGLPNMSFLDVLADTVVVVE
jgi:quinol monooxygenase YgiN